MPNASVPAGAEGVPSDPVLDLVRSYRAGMAEFSAGTYGTDEEANAAAAATFMPKLDAIEQMTIGANTCEGAIEAVRLAYDQSKDSMCEPSVLSLLRAALAHFDHPAVPDAKLKAFCDLEPLICDLKNMVDIMADLFDANLTPTVEVNGIRCAMLAEDQTETLSFASNDVVRRAHLMRKAFYEAFEGREMQ